MQKRNIADSIEVAAYQYLAGVAVPFDVDFIFKNTGIPPSEENRNSLLRFLHSSISFVEENSLFYPKPFFLKDVPIRVQPTELEIKKGILVPGHRLLPFHPPILPVDSISFIQAPDQQPVKIKTISLKEHEWFIYFSLMDIHSIPFLNVEDLLQGGSDLQIKVCQMKEFYAKNQFQLGDMLIIRPLDLLKGHFSIEFESNSHYQDHFFEIERLDRTFMNTLREVIKNYPLHPNLEKQLLQTYYNLRKNPHYTWTIPGTSLGPLLPKHPDITFSPLPNGRTIFHFSDIPLEELAIYPKFDTWAEGENVEADMESIDGILQYLLNTNDSTIVRALLIEMITHGERFNYTKIEDYLFSGAKRPFMPVPLKRKFRSLVRAEYGKIETRFDLKYAYLPITAARRKVLAQALLISQFLHSIDDMELSLEDIPQSDLMQVMEILRGFTDILQELDDAQMSGDCDIAAIQKTVKMVDAIATKLPTIFATIRQKLGD